MLINWLDAPIKLQSNLAADRLFDRWHRKMARDHKKAAKRRAARKARKITRRNAK